MNNEKKIVSDMSEKYMNEALKEAKKAFEKEEVPIGALIVKDGKIIARAHNLRETKKEACAHAEIIAIHKACKKLEAWRLEDCDMYVTLEPCAMCAGAIINARIRKLYIGAPEPKTGAVGSKLNLLEDITFNHKVDVERGVCEEKAINIMKDFFKKIRKRNKEQEKNID